MVLVVGLVLLLFYFFPDALPIWLWVLLIWGSIVWSINEPVQRLLNSRPERNLTRR